MKRGSRWVCIALSFVCSLEVLLFLPFFHFMSFRDLGAVANNNDDEQWLIVLILFLHNEDLRILINSRVSRSDDDSTSEKKIESCARDEIQNKYFRDGKEQMVSKGRMKTRTCVRVEVILCNHGVDHPEEEGGVVTLSRGEIG